jgi:ATP-dependent exoDNAse (exonuclease V) beta subunit
MKDKTHPIELTEQQKLAVRAPDLEVLVTAGAGSGKTMTLVECYLELLSQGSSPRHIAAITFTEKAAREMRNRVRKRVTSQAQSAETESDQRRWQAIEGKMDAARIGTIHSLCAEILRSHPAQARIDPAFEVIEEGIASTLKAQAVEDALAWGAGEELVAPIYRDLTANHLERVLRFLLDHRLDTSVILGDQDAHSRGVNKILDALSDFLDDPAVGDAIDELRTMQEKDTLVGDAGETLAARVDQLLGEWPPLVKHVREKDSFLSATSLFTIRREHLKLTSGKRDSRAKKGLRQLQSLYDEQINPWLGGAGSKDHPPSEEVERAFQENLPRIHKLYTYALGIYRRSLDSRYALDFDDLESLALEILSIPEISDFWQNNLPAVLVDEFQDTNHRQQEIVAKLQGDTSRLFVVGDARQSIYRFRGADVTVFRKMQREMDERGGKMVTLDLSFRAHPHLSNALDGLLSPIFGDEDGPLYKIPFSPLKPNRDAPREGVKAPFVEILGGLGSSANDARPIAARLLAQRLIELKQKGEINNWDEVALLFRASTGFPFYEDELEAAGIPFVTVAGGGFYNRPEVRDVLNMLRAIADPSDDLAMAGLLRSPAFGLTDEALYLLRWRGNKRMPLWVSLQEDLSMLGESDQAHAERALGILKQIHPLVDRLPVAELLNTLVNKTDYRSALAASHGRLLHNLDKLILDAHRSNLVRVRAFLDYVQSMRDVGAREGEAPIVESGAVQLMTIHKAKGLQFPIVVLADASRRPRGNYAVAYLHPETGLAFSPNRLEGAPLVTRYAYHINRLESDAEEDRLLYVALTRTAEKLLISGHVVEAKNGWRSGGWLSALFKVLEVELTSENQPPQDWAHSWSEVDLPNGERVGVIIATSEIEITPQLGQKVQWPDSGEKHLYKAFKRVESFEADPDREQESKRDWRATGMRARAPAIAVGKMVHEAIRRWKFPPDPSLDRYLEALALNEGLVEHRQRERAVEESVELLSRFWADERRPKIERAAQRYHELPFSRPLTDGKTAIGVIDLLYRDEDGWTIVDFKTDSLFDEDDLQAIVDNGHRKQITRYKSAVEFLMHETPRAQLCYLDYQGGVRWVTIEP